MTTRDANLSVSSRTFSIRKEMRATLLKSQELEHDFYAQMAAAVEKTTRQLCEVLSAHLQGHVLTCSETQVKEFSDISKVEPAALQDWRAVFIEMEKSIATSQQASSKLQHAADEKRKYGGFWGAKKGLDKEFQVASLKKMQAEAHDLQCKRAEQDAIGRAERRGDSMLRQLVASSPNLVNAPIVGTQIKEIVDETNNEAKSALDLFRSQQLEGIGAIRSELDALDSIYSSM